MATNLDELLEISRQDRLDIDMLDAEIARKRGAEFWKPSEQADSVPATTPERPHAGPDVQPPMFFERAPRSKPLRPTADSMNRGSAAATAQPDGRTKPVQYLSRGPLPDNRQWVTQGPDLPAEAYRGGLLGKFLARGLMGLIGGPSREQVFGPSVLQQQLAWEAAHAGMTPIERLQSDLSPLAMNLAMLGAPIKGVTLAARYPAIAPAVVRINRAGKPYEAKSLSPEGAALREKLRTIQQDIDAGRFEHGPYFDVSKRAYVDPSDYPRSGSTRTDTLPARQSTLDAWTAMLDRPDVREMLLQAFKRGRQDPLARDWGAMKQLQDKFVEEYGPELGRNLYQERFSIPMAATTAGNSPKANLRFANFANNLIVNGEIIPTEAWRLPYPIGGQFASSNLAHIQRFMRDGEPITAMGNPKRFNLMGVFNGHQDGLMIDSVLLKPWGLRAPPPGTYGIFEGIVSDLARQQGVHPLVFRDLVWAGLRRPHATKSMAQEFNEAIERTCRICDKDPEAVVRDFVRGSHPLYGAAAIAPLLYPPTSQDE